MCFLYSLDLGDRLKKTQSANIKKQTRAGRRGP